MNDDAILTANVPFHQCCVKSPQMWLFGDYPHLEIHSGKGNNADKKKRMEAKSLTSLAAS